jgi:conjugal transfer/entry exclusion protein
MQVNSAQDWLTRYKNRVLARTFNAEPSPQSRESNTLYTSLLANGATQRQRFVAPFQGAQGGASGGASYSSECCLSNNATGAFGAFQVTTDRGVVPYNGRSVQPMSVRIVS